MCRIASFRLLDAGSAGGVHHFLPAGPFAHHLDTDHRAGDDMADFDPAAAA